MLQLLPNDDGLKANDLRRLAPQTMKYLSLCNLESHSIKSVCGIKLAVPLDVRTEAESETVAHSRLAFNRP